MTNKRLEDYPHGVGNAAELDMLATKEHFGNGSAISGVSHMQLTSGETLVYLEGQREGQEAMPMPEGFQRKLTRYNVICGYLRKSRGLLTLIKGNKVEPILDNEREKIKEEFLRILKPDYFGRMPESVEFWD